VQGQSAGVLPAQFLSVSAQPVQAFIDGFNAMVKAGVEAQRRATQPAASAASPA